VARGPKNKTRWIKNLVLSLLIQEDFDTNPPAVVIRCPDRDVVLLRTGTVRAAERKVERYRREFEELGAETFCSRHGLTDSTAPGSP
jgi:hypothetical protein